MARRNFAFVQSCALMPSCPVRTSQRNTPAEEAAIARFVAEHGVTKCPAAIVAPTTAQLSAADHAAHSALVDQRGGKDIVGSAWRRPAPAPRLRVLLSRAAANQKRSATFAARRYDRMGGGA